MAISNRLQHLLDHFRSTYTVLPHPDAFTSKEVARSVRIDDAQLAKVVVVRDEKGRDFMVVLPASRHLDLDVLRQVTGRPGFRLEDERELELLFPDCELGAIPPFGHLYGMTMYVDRCLLRGGSIYFQPGNHHEVVRLRCRDYEELAQPFYSGACLHRNAAVHEPLGCSNSLSLR